MDKISWYDRVRKKKYYKERRRERTSYTQQNKGRLNRLVASHVRTLF